MGNLCRLAIIVTMSDDGKLTSDRESLRCGGSVCLGALSESG
jgi:hypothetical protein